MGDTVFLDTLEMFSLWAAYYLLNQILTCFLPNYSVPLNQVIFHYDPCYFNRNLNIVYLLYPHSQRKHFYLEIVKFLLILREYCTSYHKLVSFVLYLRIINTFLKDNMFIL